MYKDTYIQTRESTNVQTLADLKFHQERVKGKLDFIFNSNTEVLEESRSAYVLDVCRQRSASNILV